MERERESGSSRARGCGPSANGIRARSRCRSRNAEAALDVRRRLVAGDNLFGIDILDVRYESEFPVEELGLFDILFVQGPEEAAVLVEAEPKISFEARDADLGREAGRRGIVRDAAAGAFMGSLRERFGSGLKFGDPAAPVGGPLPGAIGIMGDDQPATSEFRGRKLFLVFALALFALDLVVRAIPFVAEVELPEGLRQLAVSTGRHGEDEFEIAPEIVRQSLKIIDVFATGRPRSATRTTRRTGKRSRTVLAIPFNVFVSATLPG